MAGTRSFSGKAAGLAALLTIVLGLALVACGSPEGSTAEANPNTAAVAVSGGGITADVVTTGTWQGGFNGAVRIIDTSFASPITTFEVVFKLGGGSVTGTPWNGNIAGPDASGNYTATNPAWLQYQPIKAGQTWDVGFNGAGTFTSSTIVSVKLNGQAISFGNNTDNPPVVSLASSATTVTTAGTITLAATASDDRGVSKVEFYEGSTLLGTDTSTPYTLPVSFTATNNGSHTYTAKAYDTANQSATSAAVAVTVNIGTTDRPPTVSLASSATTVTTAGTITLTATASDDKGVSKVEFYDGSALLGTDTSSPYTQSVALTQASSGTHIYSARAYDTINQVTTSATVTVTVSIGVADLPPTVSLASSASSVTTAGSITLTATASDDRGVSKVEFYDGGTLLGTDTSAPYTQTVTLAQANNGTHTYTAKAYDTANQATTSAGVSVNVNIGGGPVSYALDPPDACYSQYWVAGCETGTCGGRCQVANACSPPEDPQKASLPMTFACPRFMLHSDEMAQAAKDDWGDAAPFAYGVVGHDSDVGGLDVGSSSCCQCYQLIFERPEPGSPQPPDLPIPKPMIVQSFNTAAGGGRNFDIYMGAGGFGAFNACVPGSYSGTQTTTFGHFMYSAFPSDYPGQGGIKAINIPECKVNGTVTMASLQSAACQSKINQLCNNTAAPAAGVATETKTSCIQSNAAAGFYHQNWQIRAKRVECPVGITRVTGCRLQPQGLPAANPNAKTVATADSSFRTGYTTTTMQDCCKPSCAWKDQVTGAGLKVVDKWASFYSCDQNGVPITAP